MVALISVTKAQRTLQAHIKARRLAQGLTQKGLARRAGVSLPSLCKFEQKGIISLESFLKLLMVLDGLEAMVDAVKPSEDTFVSIDDVLRADQKKERKKGWRT